MGDGCSTNAQSYDEVTEELVTMVDDDFSYPLTGRAASLRELVEEGRN
ncbi:hypothetical protein [Streptomyces sp. cf124]|nr:hypothetical protein [Streptomyces sp. cf124]